VISAGARTIRPSSARRWISSASNDGDIRPLSRKCDRGSAAHAGVAAGNKGLATSESAGTAIALFAMIGSRVHFAWRDPARAATACCMADADISSLDLLAASGLPRLLNLAPRPDSAGDCSQTKPSTADDLTE
jgi:hypothetical protein